MRRGQQTIGRYIDLIVPNVPGVPDWLVGQERGGDQEQPQTPWSEPGSEWAGHRGFLRAGFHAGQG